MKYFPGLHWPLATWFGGFVLILCPMVGLWPHSGVQIRFVGLWRRRPVTLLSRRDGDGAAGADMQLRRETWRIRLFVQRMQEKVYHALRHSQVLPITIYDIPINILKPGDPPVGISWIF